MLSIAIATVFTVTTSGMATAAEQPIKIGLLEDASGNFALPVIPKIHATELAIDEINAKGGILGRKIDLIQYDTQSDNTRFQQMARRLIKNDKVDVIFGHFPAPRVRLSGRLWIVKNSFTGITISMKVACVTLMFSSLVRFLNNNFLH
jgi:hypothetical protein